MRKVTMKINLPVREVKIFQIEDGRRIEEHKIVKNMSVEVDIEEDVNENDINNKEIGYIGIASFSTPAGPQEIKFPIEANDITTAFSKFIPTINTLMENMQNRVIDPTDNELIL